MVSEACKNGYKPNVLALLSLPPSLPPSLPAVSLSSALARTASTTSEGERCYEEQTTNTHTPTLPPSIPPSLPPSLPVVSLSSASMRTASTTCAGGRCCEKSKTWSGSPGRRGRGSRRILLSSYHSLASGTPGSGRIAWGGREGGREWVSGCSAFIILPQPCFGHSR